MVHPVCVLWGEPELWGAGGEQGARPWGQNGSLVSDASEPTRVKEKCQLLRSPWAFTFYADILAYRFSWEVFLTLQLFGRVCI